MGSCVIEVDIATVAQLMTSLAGGLLFTVFFNESVTKVNQNPVKTLMSDQLF